MSDPVDVSRLLDDEKALTITLLRCGECERTDTGEAWRDAWWRERSRRMAPRSGFHDDDYGEDWGLGERMVCPHCGYVHADDECSYVEEVPEVRVYRKEDVAALTAEGGPLVTREEHQDLAQRFADRGADDAASIRNLVAEVERLRSLDEGREWERAEMWREKANALRAEVERLRGEREGMVADIAEWLARRSWRTAARAIERRFGEHTTQGANDG